MPDNLRADLRTLLTPKVVQATSVRLRERPRAMARTFQAALPIVLDGVAACAKDPARLDAVSGLLNTSRADRAIADMASVVEAGPDTAMQVTALQLLDLALANQTGPIANQLARSTGVKPTSAAIVLSLVATVVMGIASRQMAQGPLSVSRLADVLAGANARAPLLPALRRPTRAREDGLRPARDSRDEGHPARGVAMWLLAFVVMGAGLFAWQDRIFEHAPIVVAEQRQPPVAAPPVRTVPVPPPAEYRSVEIQAPTARAAPPSATASGGTSAGPAAGGPVSVPIAKVIPADPVLPPQPRIEPRPVLAPSAEIVLPSPPSPPSLPRGPEPAPAVVPVVPATRIDALAMRDDTPAVPAIGTTRPVPRAVGPAASGDESVESRLIGFIEDHGRRIDGATWFDFDRIGFGPGSATLSGGSRSQIELLAEILGTFPQVRVTVAGHTDSQGDPAANTRLSEARAQAVVKELAGLGIAADRLQVVGLGDQRPVADNATARGRAQNRRIAVQVTAR